MLALRRKTLLTAISMGALAVLLAGAGCEGRDGGGHGMAASEEPREGAIAPTHPARAETRALPGRPEPAETGSLAIAPARPEPAGTGSFPMQGRGGVKVGVQAPNFQLYDLKGNLVTLSDYRGGIVFLNFWATWCGPCKVEMPAMEELYREFNRKDFEILAVSTDQQGAAVTRPFSEEIGLTFPILHDSDFRVGVAYGARTLPMTFLIDRSGIVTHRIFGARDWQSPEGRQLIKNLLDKR